MENENLETQHKEDDKIVPKDMGNEDTKTANLVSASQILSQTNKIVTTSHIPDDEYASLSQIAFADIYIKGQMKCLL